MRAGSISVMHVCNRLDGHGGAEVSLTQLVLRLRDAGVRQAVVPLVENQTVDELRAAGIPVYGGDRGSLRALRRIRRAIHAFRPDIVHSSLFEADILTRLAAGRRTRVVSGIVNAQYSPAARAVAASPRRLELLRRIDGLLARRVNVGFHAITHAVAAEAVEALGIDPARIVVVPRFRDRRLLGEPTGERRDQVRAALGLEASRPVVLNVARQERQKGQRHLIEAFAAISSSRPDAVLLVAGRTGAATPELERLVNRLGLSRRVRFLGVREDVPDLLCAADVFAFSSLYEGLGGALVEAMAMGAPIVAFDIPAVRETVGSAGLLVPVGDSDALAAGIERLLDDPAEARRLGTEGRQRYERSYTPEVLVGRMRDMYEEIASWPLRGREDAPNRR